MSTRKALASGMRLRPLTVGPIVGETTPKRVRIWGRGDADVIDGRPRRCFGVLRMRKGKRGKWSRTHTFKMNPNFDMTGIAVVDGLRPQTRYEYQVGCCFADMELDEIHVGDPDWSDASVGRFTTASNDDQMPRTLVAGSCRYLLKTFLGDFHDDRGDKTFRSILRQIRKDGANVDQLIMMGDQIYADDLGFLGADRTVDKFYERYRTAFGQPWIRELMSCVPTYMTLDDHEIEDNWPEKASGKDRKTLLPNALHAYQAYQLSHGPNIPVRGGRLVGTPQRLWYQYRDGCCDFFVTDTRTERVTGPPDRRRIMSAEQMRALKKWLKDGSGRVKLVVSSVPLFPDLTSDERDDKWSGFAAQRSELLAHIDRNGIEKVVFLSGDLHASLSAELSTPSGGKIVSVIASSFFWPYPHSSARDFVREGAIDAQAGGTFNLAKVSKVVARDNFVRLHVSPSQVAVEVYERKKARPVTSRVHRF